MRDVTWPERCALVAVLLTWLTVGAILTQGCPARADEMLPPDPPLLDHVEVADAVGTLAPWTPVDGRMDWAERIIAADAEHDFGRPLLLAAIIRRESAYWHSVDQGRKRGPAGEIGAMQVHPTSGWRQFVPDGCPRRWEPLAAHSRCSMRTGVAAIAYIFEACPGVALGPGGELQVWALRQRELRPR